MMKVLLIYSPFCTPATPPYAIANIYSFLKVNSVDVDILDLNLEFHKLKFPKEYDYYRDFILEDYEEKTNEFMKESSKIYSENNKKIVKGEKPESFDELIELIRSKKPDLVAFSVVYSSQVFYTKALIEELNKEGIKCVIGGPAINDKLKEKATFCNNEFELLNHINSSIKPNKAKVHDYIDFS